MSASPIAIDITKLQDILDAMDELSHTSLSDLENRMRLHAAAFEFTIIGEASRQVSDTFKKEHSDLPWREMQDMRNKIVHDYGAISPKRMMEVIEDEFPELRRKIDALLNRYLSKNEA